MVVGLLAALLMSGCSSAPEGTPARGTPGGGAESSPVPDAEDITQAQLRQALQELVLAGTGQSVASVSQAPEEEQAQALLPTVDGQWSFKERLSSTVSTSTNSDVGQLTVTTIIDGPTAYVQALFDGSAFEPDCWVRVARRANWQPTAVVPVARARVQPKPTPPGENVTMPLADVLGALGYEKLVSAAASAMEGVRVGATVRFTDGTFDGWGVTEAAITAALDQMPGGTTTVQAKRFFLLVSGRQWDVSLRAIGDPVEISRPDATQVIDPARSTCSG